MFETDQVDAVDRRIQRIGSAMLFAEPVLAVGSEAGIDNPLTFYAGGRGGVLGTSAWEQIVSAFAFFPPDVVEGIWEGVTAWGEPAEMARLYAEGLAAFGSGVFPTEAGQTFAALGQKVADGVTPLGYPLFVGWRAMNLPDDGREAAAIVMMMLRELRGDVHIQDIAAAGISPLAAEIVVRGAGGVPLHGWEPPYPDPDEHRAKVEAATAQTTRRMGAIYEGALSDVEWREFSDSVATLATALRESTA